MQIGLSLDIVKKYRSQIPMNSQDSQNWNRRLEQLEKEMNPDVDTSDANSSNLRQSLSLLAIRFREWLAQLPAAARLIVIGIGILFLFSLLNTVLKLVASLFSIAVLAIILYLLYRFLIAPMTND
jgi:hypothetical protein